MNPLVEENLIFKNDKKAKTHMYQGFGFYLCISLIKNVKLNVFLNFLQHKSYTVIIQSKKHPLYKEHRSEMFLMFTNSIRMAANV